ncbi:MAG: diguanylate cyclase [Acidimicrobiales bacterium]|nr:diguanylate cyclase [Acidimicrobiales bacterium]
MKNQQALTPLAIGASGLILGVIAALSGAAWLAIVVGVSALAAGVFGYQLALPGYADENSAGANAAPTATNTKGASAEQVAQLEEALAQQVQARMHAEEAVKSLGEQLAAAQQGKPATVATGAAVDASATAAAALKDPASGLFTEDYFQVAVDARIAAARRHLRPVAVGLICVVSGEEGEHEPIDPGIIGPVLIETLRDSDTACRLSQGRYGIVLEDTPENGAIWTMERIRRKLGEQKAGLTVWAGLACYPAHAFDGGELMRQAVEALDGAQEWHQDRIEVATAD